jgi:hypothetical protein
VHRAALRGRDASQREAFHLALQKKTLPGSRQELSDTRQRRIRFRSDACDRLFSLLL